MIEPIRDYDNKFFREITVALAKTMSKQIRWINYFQPLNEGDTGRKRVFLPFYTSLTGEERFIFDAFVDDIVDVRVNMNTDQFQRGSITFQGFNARSDEFANPNQYLSQKADINGTLRRVISKVKAVPVSVNYDIEIKLDTYKEVDIVSTKLMDMFYNYMFFSIDYYGLKIDAMLKLPDDKSIEIPREITMDLDRKKTIKFSLEVSSYYPIFMIDIDDLITCDNDNDIDWDSLNIPRPTNDFSLSLQNYNYSQGQTITVLTSGSTGDIISTQQGQGEIKRIYWENYILQQNRVETIRKERLTQPNPNLWNKENFGTPD